MSALLQVLTVLLLFARPATATELDAHWTALPPPSQRLVDADWDDDTVVALLADGSLVRWEDSGWVPWAPPPDQATQVSGLDVGPDGVAWTWGDSSTSVRHFDGSWQPAETVLAIAPNAGVVGGPDGRAWGATSTGRLVVRRDGTWREVEHVRFTASDTYGITSLGWDGEDGAMVVSRRRSLWHVRDGEVERLELPAGAIELADVDATGTPLLTGSALLRRSDGDWTAVLDQPVAHAGWSEEGWWALHEDRSWHGLGTRVVEIPLPAMETVRRLEVGDRGRALVLDAADRLHVSQPGPGPRLRDVASAWGVASLGETGRIHAADFDRDGRDDLLVQADGRGWRLLLQRERSFVDHSDGWGLDLPVAAEILATCDLDGNGLPDLLALEAVADGYTLRLFRTHAGWFEEVTDRGLRDADTVGLDEGHGRASCADVDSDGDLDVFLPTGRLTDGVRLLENLGSGHMAHTSMAVSGLGSGTNWAWQVLPHDLDADGLLDYAMLVTYHPGHRVLQGLPDGRLAERTEGSRFGAAYAQPADGWPVDVDGDGTVDLLTLDRTEGLHLYRGLGDFRFRHEGFGLPHASGLEEAPPTAVADVALDALPDVLSCPGGACQLLVATPDGFVDHTAALPLARDGVQAVVPLDLGGDGDLDLLLLRQGDEVLLETLEEGPGAVLAPAAPLSASVLRRVRWVRPWPDAVALALLLLTWLGVWAGTRRTGSRIALGRLDLGLLVGLAGVAGWLALLERPVLWRAGGVALGVVGLVGLGRAEGALHRVRSARRVAGYRLGELLGRGGMGTVYKATEVATGREVALKLVHPDLLETDRDRALFRREAEIGASLEDPRLVRILAWGEWTVRDGERVRPTAYLVMELVRGRSVREALEATGTLSVPVATAIGLQTAQALAVIHRHGVVHRDVKPENVMIDRSGGIKLMDFGAARRAGQRTHSKRQVLGTLGYLAPEQGRGQPPDPRSDVYATGVMLYELLTGRRPFRASDLVELLAELLEKEPEPPSSKVAGIPAELEAVVLRCLAKDPDDRFPNAEALAAALEPFAGSLARLPGSMMSSSTTTLRTGGSELVSAAGRSGGSMGLVAKVLATLWRYARNTRSPTVADFAVRLLEDTAHEGPLDPKLTRRLHRIQRTGDGDPDATQADPEDSTPMDHGAQATWFGDDGEERP